MRHCILSAKIISENGVSEKKDLVIDDGKIISVQSAGSVSIEDVEIIKGNDLYVAPGFVDIGCQICDPGFENKEDFLSFSHAAVSGGFTHVLPFPNTKPIIQHKEAVQFLINRKNDFPLNILPIAAVTLNTKGEELTEILDLHHAGAKAFSDGDRPLLNADLLIRALLYLKKADSVLLLRPEEKTLSNYGVVNEGIVATSLGLKGIPALSEEIMIARDLSLNEYAEGKIHFVNISTSRSVALIREAKKRGMKVTCDTAVHNLIFDETQILSFDTNYKVNPPLRSIKDINALWDGLKDGTIDFIVSSHKPQDEESKNLEFDLAEFGVIGIETVLPALTSEKSKISIDILINKISILPRRIFNLPVPKIEKNAIVDLTVFDLDSKWNYTSSDINSKSKNSPFINKEFSSRIYATFLNEKFFVNPKCKLN
jgi:dihydroorotase